MLETKWSEHLRENGENAWHYSDTLELRHPSYGRDSPTENLGHTQPNTWIECLPDMETARTYNTVRDSPTRELEVCPIYYVHWNGM